MGPGFVWQCVRGFHPGIAVLVLCTEFWIGGTILVRSGLIMTRYMLGFHPSIAVLVLRIELGISGNVLMQSMGGALCIRMSGMCSYTAVTDGVVAFYVEIVSHVCFQLLSLIRRFKLSRYKKIVHTNIRVSHHRTGLVIYFL